MQRSSTLHYFVLAVGAILHTLLFVLAAFLLAPSLLSDVYWIVFVAVVVAGSTAEAAMTTNAVDANQCDSTSYHARWVAQAVGILIVTGFVFAHVERSFSEPGLPYWPSIGIVLLAMGFGLRLWAIATIGSDFQTAIAMPKTIVTHGPYRWIKHPGEWGMVLLAVGGPLSLGSTTASLVVLGFLTPMAVWRIRKENQLLDWGGKILS